MKNIIDFISENINIIFNILILCLITYLIYKTYKLEKFEKFDTSPSVNNQSIISEEAYNILLNSIKEDINTYAEETTMALGKLNYQELMIEAINTQYSADLISMRNLAQISNTILSNNDILTIPSNTINMQNISVSNIAVDSGTINTTTFVRYMIMPWAGGLTIPRGWVLCNGLTYALRDVNEYLNDINYNSTNVTIIPKKLIGYTGKILDTDKKDYLFIPNLIGKFILGAGTINHPDIDMYMTNLDGSLNDKNSPSPLVINSGISGGKSSLMLSKTDIPPHRHTVAVNNSTQGAGESANDARNSNYADGSFSSILSALRAMPLNAPQGRTKNIFTDYGGLGSPVLNPVPNSDGSLDPAYIIQSPITNMPPFYALVYIMKL